MAKAKRLCLLNRKGGVGKTTLSIALAEAIVWERSEHVLLIDLDPQGSASEALLSDEQYCIFVEQERTVAHYLERRMGGAREPAVSIRVAMVHALRERPHVRLDVVPNTSRLWDVEFKFNQKQRDKFPSVVRSFLSEVSEGYDWVIIDCPPGRTLSAEAGLRDADLVLCPIVPDRLSMWGMRHMKRYFQEVFATDPVRWKFILNRVVPRAVEFKELVHRTQAAGSEFVTDVLGPPMGASVGSGQLMGTIPDREAFKRRMARLQDYPRAAATLTELYEEDSATALKRAFEYVLKELAT